MGAGIFVGIFAILAWVALFLLCGALIKLVCSKVFGWEFGDQVEKLFIAAVVCAALGALVGLLLGLIAVPLPFFGRS